MKLGTTTIGKLYLGTGLIQKMYLGATVVYNATLATALRVRRSNDNAEADIPLAVDGFVDETSLTTHVGANNGFVARWHDQSGNDNDAIQDTVDNQPRIVNAGTVDEGLVFDGTNDFLTLTTPLSFAGEFTLAIWAKRDTTNTFDSLFGYSVTFASRVLIATGDSQGLYVQFTGNLTTSFSTPGVGTNWTHYAITRNSDGKCDAYVNGSHVLRLFGDTVSSGTVEFNSIGAAFSEHYHDGLLANAYAANVALSEAEIAALMNGTLPASGTVLYLKSKDVTP